MSDMLPAMSVVEDTFGICRLGPFEHIPDWALKVGFASITRTKDELSIVCNQENIPQTIRHEKGWKALKIEGPLDFTLTGILSAVSSILAQKGISIFAVSTYDTDYILVRQTDLDKAVEVLRKERYEVSI